MRAKDRFGDLEELRKALYEVPDAVAQEEEAEEVIGEEIPKTGLRFLPVLVVLLLTAALGIAIAWYLPQIQLSTVLEKLGISQETVIDYVLEQSGLEEETLPVETVVSEATDNSQWIDNIMCRFPMTKLDEAGISIDSIERVFFLDTLETAPNNVIDVSKAAGSVYAWTDVVDGDLVLYFAAEGGINGKIACENLFVRCTNLEEVVFGDAFHTDFAVNMSSMFYGCTDLEKVDVENLDTGRTTDMSQMFYLMSDRSLSDSEPYDYNTRLKSLDVSGWDVSKVKNMSKMFFACKGLQEINVSAWDISNVYDMSEMFALSGLRKLDAGNWQLNTARGLDLSGMFYDCRRLHRVEVSGWNTKSVVDMSNMFSYCVNLWKANVGEWDVGRVQNMTRMFCGSGISDMDLENWDVSSVKSMDYMFYGCENLNNLTLGDWHIREDLSHTHFCSGEATINGQPWKYFFRNR